MLLGQHACGQSFGGIACKYGHHCLIQDRAVVQFRSHLMYGRPGEAAARVDGALMRVQAGERGQQGRMNESKRP